MIIVFSFLLFFFTRKERKALRYRVHALAGSGSPCWLLGAKLDPLSVAKSQASFPSLPPPSFQASGANQSMMQLCLSQNMNHAAFWQPSSLVIINVQKTIF
jgi:hypothetical protein